jgi:GNAT superfamily N-acetyltransferase
MADRRTSLRERIAAKIDRSDDAVFLTREFRRLGCERHVLRALRQLVEEGRLIRLGYGVYGRAEISRLTGKPMLAATGGFIDAAHQTLDKLGVPWEQTEFQRAYNEGRSTQVPVNAAVRVVKSRITRKLRHQGNELIMERG